MLYFGYEVNKKKCFVSNLFKHEWMLVCLYLVFSTMGIFGVIQIPLTWQGGRTTMVGGRICT